MHIDSIRATIHFRKKNIFMRERDTQKMESGFHWIALEFFIVVVVVHNMCLICQSLSL